MTEHKPLKHNRWEYVIPVLAITSLVISCIIISSKKYFWNDELFSYYFISDPSFSKMLAAFHDKINNTPILYFLLGWIWDKIFGSSELSYRLFSSMGICIALVIVWITIRRTYSFWATTIGTLGVFCTSKMILLQNAEARMYGLFLAVCALAFLFYNHLCNKPEPSKKILVFNACIHAAIIHTHLYGPFYSGVILLSLFLSDRYHKIFRPKIYLSIILSWLSFILYIPSFLNQADAGNPYTWIPIPTFFDLVTFYNLTLFLNWTLLTVLMLISGLQFIFGTHGVRSSEVLKKVEPNRDSEVSLIIFAILFMILPVFVWVFSLTIKPVFWERYMIPSAIGIAILLTFVFSRLVSTPIISNVMHNAKSKIATPAKALIITASLTILTAYVLWQPVRIAIALRQEVRPGTLDIKQQYSNLPVVFLSSGEFLESHFYSPFRSKYFTILDWEVAISEKSGVWATQQFKHLTALKNNYPHLFKNNILTTSEFLEKHDRFLVKKLFYDTINCPKAPKGLDMAHKWVGIECPQWVEMRLINNNAYKVTSMGQSYGKSFLLVERYKK